MSPITTRIITSIINVRQTPQNINETKQNMHNNQNNFFFQFLTNGKEKNKRDKSNILSTTALEFIKTHQTIKE